MRNLRRIIFATIATLVVVSAAASASAHARTSAQYRIEGRGWGHGIGMSQYGAEGYAKRGWSYDRIIQHYYSGTVVAPRPSDGPTSLRVLLQSYLQPARLQMTSDGIVRQGAATMGLVAGDVVSMRASGGNVVVTRARSNTPPAVLVGGGSADPVIVPDTDGGVRILFTADHARRGTSFRGTLSGHVFEGKVSIVNTVPFESYLRGVVPDEMPPSWSAEALKSQAIAARSYALRSLRTDFNWFDVYSDTRSQVYGGIGAEEASTDAAIAATDGLVARVGDANGEVAQTFFFSTSAGRTAANEHVWSSSPYTYLRSVVSPFERESRYFYWTGSDIQRYTPMQLGAKLGMSGLRSASVRVHPSGYVRQVVARTRSGIDRISGSSVQARLGLRSSWFRLQLLRMSGPVVAGEGRYVTLRGAMPRTGRTFLRLQRGGTTRTVELTAGEDGTSWVVRTRMSGNLLVSMVRHGIVGPRLFVASTATAQGQRKLRILRAQRRAR